MKGQTSVEFIIILSVILIIVGVGASMLFGLTDTVDRVDESVFIYWDNADVGITSYLINETHINITVKNNMYNTIRLTSIDVGSFSFSTYQVLNPSQTFEIIQPFAHGKSVNEPYEFYATMRYLDYESDQPYNFTGQVPLKGTIGN